MRINKQIISKTACILRSKVKQAGAREMSNPLSSNYTSDILIKEAPILTTPLTKKQIVEMKPSEFKKLLDSRTDIPEELRVVGEYQTVAKIHSPEQLSLYDEINNILLQRNIDFNTRKSFLSRLMSYSPENAEYSKKLLPKLIEKGYDLELLSGINISEHNYKYVEAVLKKQPVWKAKIEKLTENLIKADIKLRENMSRKAITPEAVKKITEANQAKAKQYEYDLIQTICRYVEKDNVKYLDEWSRYTDTIPFDSRIGGIGQFNTIILDYWTKDSLKILQEFSTPAERNNHSELLEVILRRGHDYNSVKRIFGNNKITGNAYCLLEFKNPEKFKYISLENFNELTIPEKKEFINAYISAISVKNARFGRYDGIETLKANIKMYENLDTSSRENFLKTYSDTLKKMIESLPPSEREIIKTKANWGKYSRKYREQNPIPALVDDLEKLPFKYATINGKKIKVSEINKDTDLIVSGHCTSGDAFLNIEALEFTDPNVILCVGTKGKGHYVHYTKDGYSVALNPRLGEDFWIQARHDIDSGNNATKNVTNVGKMYKGNNMHYSYIPDLIKNKLNLSQVEYTSRMSRLRNCTTLDEIGKIDKEMEIAIREVIKENQLYEGILRPEPMGIMIPFEMSPDKINQNVLDYLNLRNLRLIRVKDNTKQADEIRKKAAVEEAVKAFKSFTS